MVQASSWELWQQNRAVQKAAADNNYDSALAAVDRALEIEPDNRAARYSKALALLQLGRYTEAGTILGDLSFAQDTLLEAYRRYNRAWAQNGQGDSLQEEYRRMLSSMSQQSHAMPGTNTAGDTAAPGREDLKKIRSAAASKYTTALQMYRSAAEVGMNSDTVLTAMEHTARRLAELPPLPEPAEQKNEQQQDSDGEDSQKKDEDKQQQSDSSSESGQDQQKDQQKNGDEQNRTDDSGDSEKQDDKSPEKKDDSRRNDEQNESGKKNDTQEQDQPGGQEDSPQQKSPADSAAAESARDSAAAAAKQQKQRALGLIRRYSDDAEQINRPRGDSGATMPSEGGEW
ncbi:MAG: tetratricopeptide repeat protein [Fibrobacterota bacterium]